MSSGYILANCNYYTELATKAQIGFPVQGYLGCQAERCAASI